MAPLLLSVLLAACILILVDHAAGTKNMVLSAASFSSVYLIIFHSRRAIAAASSTDERRFSIRAAWCASLILVLILGFEAQQYAVQSTVVYVWAITGSIQLMVLIILEVLHPVAIDEALHSSALV